MPLDLLERIGAPPVEAVLATLRPLTDGKVDHAIELRLGKRSRNTKGLDAARRRCGESLGRCTGDPGAVIGMAGLLWGLLPLGHPAFYLRDSTFILAFLFGLAGGTARRAADERAEPASTAS